MEERKLSFITSPEIIVCFLPTRLGRQATIIKVTGNALVTSLFLRPLTKAGFKEAV